MSFAESLVSFAEKSGILTTGGLSGGLVGDMKHGLELGGCALRLPGPPGGKTSREETLGFDNGHGRYGDGGVA